MLRYRRVHGFDSLLSLTYFQVSISQLLKFCDDLCCIHKLMDVVPNFTSLLAVVIFVKASLLSSPVELPREL